jgi:hypothetical protein
MAARACIVPPGVKSALAGCDYSDAFEIPVAEEMSALDVARAMVSRNGWIETLLLLRNIIVAPLGLKAGKRDLPLGKVKIGIFPIISSSPERVVMGLDDRHLDFRLVVDVERQQAATRAVASTLIRRHNALGRIYLIAVLPFHRRIVPAMLERAAKAR